MFVRRPIRRRPPNRTSKNKRNVSPQPSSHRRLSTPTITVDSLCLSPEPARRSGGRRATLPILQLSPAPSQGPGDSPVATQDDLRLSMLALINSPGPRRSVSSSRLDERSRHDSLGSPVSRGESLGSPGSRRDSLTSPGSRRNSLSVPSSEEDLPPDPLLYRAGKQRGRRDSDSNRDPFDTPSPRTSPGRIPRDPFDPDSPSPRGSPSRKALAEAVRRPTARRASVAVCGDHSPGECRALDPDAPRRSSADSLERGQPRAVEFMDFRHRGNGARPHENKHRPVCRHSSGGDRRYSGHRDVIKTQRDVGTSTHDGREYDHQRKHSSGRVRTPDFDDMAWREPEPESPKPGSWKTNRGRPTLKQLEDTRFSYPADHRVSPQCRRRINAVPSQTSIEEADESDDYVRLEKVPTVEHAKSLHRHRSPRRSLPTPPTSSPLAPHKIAAISASFAGYS